VTVEQYDWARLERERGDEIRARREEERAEYVALTDIARLFGIRRQRVVAILKGKVELARPGRGYLIKREEATAVINRVREELEDAYVRRRARHRPKERRDA
jgi:hypothetical protein